MTSFLASHHLYCSLHNVSFSLSLGALVLTIQDTKRLVPLSISSANRSSFSSPRQRMSGDLTAERAAFVCSSNTYYAWGQRCAQLGAIFSFTVELTGAAYLAARRCCYRIEGFQSWVSRRNKANDLFGCVVHSMNWQTMSQFKHFSLYAEESNV